MRHHVYRGSQPCGGALGYLPEDIYREVAYIAYHFNWSRNEIMEMPHNERKRWIAEIAKINRTINVNMKKTHPQPLSSVE
jgi:hypothetical protein